MHAKIAFGALAVLGVAAGIAIYTRHEPHGELPAQPSGGSAVVSLAKGAANAGSGSATLEKPWLTREATEQIVAKDGGLGPLFAGVVLGGDAPSDAVRTRIAEFAKANDVTIDIEVAGGKVTAVRFAVAYGGCCGYEGADKLGLRFQRPKLARSEGEPFTWPNDWAIDLDGLHARIAIHANRVNVRWERTVTTKQLVERADALIGADLAAVRAAAGDRWHASETGGDRNMLELPYMFVPYLGWAQGPLSERFDLGVGVFVANGKIHRVVIGYSGDDERVRAELDKVARAKWGAPRKHDGDLTWRTGTRVVEHAFRELTIRAP